MIVLPSISQVKYITKTDTLVCYSNTENRTIARLLLYGEEDKLLAENCDSIVSSLNDKIHLLNTKINIYDTTIKDITTSYNYVSDLAKKSDKANRKIKRQLTFSKILVTTLTVVLGITILK